mgnify:CR=1 FL=1
MTGNSASSERSIRWFALLVCLTAIVAPATAGVVGADPGASRPGEPAATAPDASTAFAGSTTVRLEPTGASVDEGERRTLSVVVSDADGGVGAVSGSITVVESEHATIEDVEFAGDPGVQDVGDGGSSIDFEAALMDTAQTGEVTIAEVTVRGQLPGATDLSLSIDSLGDEDGVPYDVGGTPDSALTVNNTRTEVPLSISADTDSAAAGESVTFTVVRADSDARVEANVTVGDRTVQTDVDGEATVVVRESMVSDAGTITAVASKDPTSQERYTDDSVTIDYGAGDDGTDGGDGTDSTEGGGSDGGADDGTGDDGTPAGDTDGGSGAIVSTDPATVDLAVGETATVDVVVTNVDGGVGAGNVTASIADPSVAEITGVSFVGDPGITDGAVTDDGASATAEFALRDGNETTPVPIVRLTLRGVSSGSTTLALSAPTLGDEGGTSYTVASVPDSGLSVSEDGGSGDAGSTATATDDGSSTATATGDGASTATATDSSAADGSQTATEGSQSDDSATSTPQSSGGGAAGGPVSDNRGTDEFPIPGHPITTAAILTAVVFLLGLLVVGASG